MYEETKNRQMQLMLAPARERLKKYTPDELCRKGRIRFDASQSAFLVPSMGRVIPVKYPDFAIEQALDMWHHLTILQYMDTADGHPLSGRWIGLSDMSGGLSRGKGFDKDIDTMVARGLVDVSLKAVKDACLALGGEPAAYKADVSMIIHYAPMFPVLFNFWEGDDEFPPSCKVLVDEFAAHYLTIEAAGGACSAVVQEILKAV